MRKRSCAILFITGFVICVQSQSAFAETVASFRTDIIGKTINPHADSSGAGTWSYYRSSTVNPSDAGANLTAYVWNAVNSEFKDPSADYGQVRQTNVHPGDGNYTVVRWQAASNDTYLVDGFFQRNPTDANGDGVFVFVYVNGDLQTSISTNLPAATGQPQVAFNFITDLESGQFIDFVVFAGESYSFDRTDFDVTIANLAPEVTNWSFENPDYELGGTEGGTVIPGWSKEESAWGSPGIQIDGKLGSPPAPDGDQWCFFNLVANQAATGGATGSIWQAVGYVIKNHIYTTEFVLGHRQDNAPIDVTVSLWQGGSAPSMSGGSTLIGSETFRAPDTSSSVTQTNQASFASGEGINYEQMWLRFDASTPGGTSGANIQLLLDAVTLTAEPDPSKPGTIILIM